MRLIEAPPGDGPFLARLAGANPLDFLGNLAGPAAIVVPGADRSRTRCVVTLLHGNEPSGVIALHRWLRAGATPAVDGLVIVASVHAALEAPGFANRMLPGFRDLNRCFSEPFDDVDGRLALSILDCIRGARCEAVVDLHNNTGNNPAYGILTKPTPAGLGLISMFARACMVSNLTLHTMVEAIDAEVPAVAIECGKSGDPAADDVALLGMRKFFEGTALDLNSPREIDQFVDPVRVSVGDRVSVAFGDAPVSGVQLTLVRHIDSYNFGTVLPGQRLGWVDGDVWPIRAHGASGDDRSRELFEIRDGQLVAKQAIVPVMMTTDARVAVADCLCYLVTRVPDATRDGP